MNRLEIIKNHIERLLAQQDQVIIAIDGKCTSGKTTLASKLAEIYDCNVFHMDDFFLRRSQRTPERVAEVGRNVDYERFLEEILLPLKSGKAFSYRPFDCSTFTLAAPVAVTPKKLNIIEGTYSHHPYFGNPYDLKILLTVDEETQRQRILERPAFLHKRFFEDWIPMENRYFDALQIPEECDLVNRPGDELRLIQMRSHFITNESKMTAALTSQLEKLWLGSCCMIHGQKLVVFLNLSHYTRFTKKLFNQELAVFLRESLLLAGISRSFTNIRWIQAAYQQTEIALDAGEELTPTYWYFKYDDYAYWDLLYHGCRNFLPEQICHPAINVLRAYDQVNNTELAPTLKSYIKNQYNAVGTANSLFIARSTFLKRLARIEELTKVDLNDFSTRLYIALSFELFDQYDHDSATMQCSFTPIP